MRALSPKKSAVSERLIKCLKLLVILMLLAMVAYMCIGNTNGENLEHFDEVRHASNAYEMVQSGDWVVQTYMGEADYYNLKPPLGIWLIALCFRLLGYKLIFLRLSTAICALLMCVILARWLWKRIGFISALLGLGVVLSFGCLFHVHGFRTADMEGPYILFFTTAMLAMLDSRRDFRSLYISTVCFGLAFMTKSLHAAMIPLICLLYVFLTGQRRQLTLRRCLGLLAAGLAPILPWAVLRYARDGMEFFSRMLSTDVMARVGKTTEIPPNLYIEVLFSEPVFIVCLALTVVLGAALLWRRLRCGQSIPRELLDAIIGCALWLFIPLLLFSIPSFKVQWYIYPCLIAQAVLTAAMLRAWLDTSPVGRLRKVGVGVIAVVLGLSVGYCTATNLLHVKNDTYTQAYQSAMMKVLDRSLHSDAELYIEYNETDADGRYITKWNEVDTLAANMFGGGRLCPGGYDAYQAAEGHAVLVIGWEEHQAQIDTAKGCCLMGTGPVRVYDNEK